MKHGLCLVTYIPQSIRIGLDIRPIFPPFLSAHWYRDWPGSLSGAYQAASLTQRGAPKTSHGLNVPSNSTYVLWSVTSIQPSWLARVSQIPIMMIRSALASTCHESKDHHHLFQEFFPSNSIPLTSLDSVTCLVQKVQRLVVRSRVPWWMLTIMIPSIHILNAPCCDRGCNDGCEQNEFSAGCKKGKKQFDRRLRCFCWMDIGWMGWFMFDVDVGTGRAQRCGIALA